MDRYVLRVSEDRLGVGARYGRSLPPLNRVLYALQGELRVSSRGVESSVRANGAWFGAADCLPTAGPTGVVVLRWELLRGAGEGGPDVIPDTASQALLQQPIELEPGAQYLMRCDRVDFDPGGVALPHRHKGGGIRCLIAGALELRVGDEPPRTIRPGQAWFESGRDPVYAAASPEIPTSFIRVSILPRAIRGERSIVYVDPEAAGRGRPRKYTIFVDEPIELEAVTR